MSAVVARRSVVGQCGAVLLWYGGVLLERVASPFGLFPVFAVPVLHAVDGVELVASPSLRLLVAVPFHGEVHTIVVYGVHQHKVVSSCFQTWKLQTSVVWVYIGGVGVGVYASLCARFLAGQVVVFLTREASQGDGE